MPILAPIATWKPFTGKGTRSLTPDIVCAHTMVGTLPGSYAWANQPGNSYWHFGLGGDGTLWQCHDLAYRSAANLEGNYHIIPIETADKESMFPMWAGSDVPAWTQAQVDRLVELIIWLCRRFDIPPAIVPDSKPGRRGLAYHRQGIDPWRVSGGELWSKSTGKVCPGDRRIAQFRNEVVPRVAAAINGEPTPPVPDLEEDDDMVVFRRLSNRSAMSLASSKLVQISGEEAVDRYKTEGVPVVWLDEDEWARYVKAYGPVVV